ncbi:MAG TPA: bifunctional 5,10-methylenetetrahydrofolate dehydrogenase/5,10-methenyltetrahydrofolate cyclohydrolase [Nitrososphaerales archaeon]|nr:bifunctional 5,10-methylenetetrahydrofolate dehydrogenase/5,10-methenyltetrahydrofolate cyclohydrolase [Nitrososphaerales archaeon]
MTATIIDGKLVASKVREKVASAVKKLKENNVEPCLATVLAGDDSASATYVRTKQNACADIGIRTIDHHPHQDYTTEQLVELVTILNEDKNVHGILVQLPLPHQITEFVVTGMISPSKDVDGLTPFNAGLLAYDKAMLVPCTPAGVMELLRFYNIGIEGKNVVVINRSMLVGKPLSLLMLHQNATVSICHSKTHNIAEKCRSADILVTAVGMRDKFVVDATMVKEGAVVIDIATNRVNGKLVGDVDFDNVKEKTSFITPVPGGVGPMTVAMLLRNTVLAASLIQGIPVDV